MGRRHTHAASSRWGLWTRATVADRIAPGPAPTSLAPSEAPPATPDIAADPGLALHAAQVATAPREEQASALRLE